MNIKNGALILALAAALMSANVDSGRRKNIFTMKHMIIFQKAQAWIYQQ